VVKKILLGLVEGALAGVLVVALLSRLHVTWTPLLLYAAVAGVGAMVGAVAGRPIWAREAKLEALLKSLAGSFVAVTAMYGARKWLGGTHVNLEALGGTSGSIGDVPAAVLPIIGALLGFVFQVDDAFGGETEAPRRRVESPSPRGAESTDETADDADVSERRAERRG